MQQSVLEAQSSDHLLMPTEDGNNQDHNSSDEDEDDENDDDQDSHDLDEDSGDDDEEGGSYLLLPSPLFVT